MALPRPHAAANPGLLRSSQGGLSQPPATAAIWEGGHESHLRLSPLLRRGRRITDDTRSSEESEESEEEGEGSDKPDPVAWSMPDGFTLGAEPSKLDASLVGKHIYMRWKDYGWQLGKVYEQITNANPRLFKKFNYRVVWADTANQGPDEPARGGELRARLGRGSRLVGGAGAQGGRRRRSGVGGGRQRARAEGSKLADDWG